MAAHSFRQQYIRSHKILLDKIVINGDDNDFNKAFENFQPPPLSDDDVIVNSSDEEQAKENIDFLDDNELEISAQPSFDDDQHEDAAAADFEIHEIPTNDDTRWHHSCDVCSATFPLRNDLLWHTRKNHENPCPICRKCSESESIMRAHIGEHFRKSEPLKCDECPLELPSVSDFCVHLRLHRQQAPKKSSDLAMSQCGLCKKKMLTRSMKRHMRVVHPLTKSAIRNREEGRPLQRLAQLTCENCGLEQSDEEQMLAHMRDHHSEDNFVQSFSDAEQYQDTIETYEDNKPQISAAQTFEMQKYDETANDETEQHRCDFCSETFQLKQYLTWHIRIKHDYPCPICGQCSETERDMRTHIMYTHAMQNEPMKCDECSEQFKSVNDLCVHVRLHRGLRRKKRCELAVSQCSLCDKIMMTKSLKRHIMDIHERPHLKQKRAIERVPLLCEICGAEKSRKEYMIVHMRLHSGERPFKCPICDKAFASHSQCSEHRKTAHEGVAKKRRKRGRFDCKQCSNSYPILSSLKAHIFSKHTQAGRPFQCTVCSLKFKTVLGLGKHMDMHERRSNLCCQICDKKYDSIGGWRKHLFNVHQISNPIRSTLKRTAQPFEK